MARIRYAAPEDDAQAVPADQRCIWPGCNRHRAPGRSSGSGRQPEYCEKANRPEDGGGPEHTARNRWALREREQREREQRERAQEAASADHADAGRSPGAEGRTGQPAGDGEQATAGRLGQYGGTGQHGGTGHQHGAALPLSAAKLHASDLLEQARRQHAGALAALAAERELYERLAG